MAVIPKHVGIIMDGNGRWAQMHGLPRFEGHKKGVENAREIIRAAKKVGISVLTLYAFSLENWQRPEDEINTLMELLNIYLTTELKDLLQEDIRFRAIGDRNKLPQETQKLVEDTEELTSSCKALTLVTALSYSGRDEILRAVRKAISLGLRPEEINEDQFKVLLDTSDLPPTDLIIRTGGEKRISNFLLWQCAYAELYFADTMWPDFTREEFLRAIEDFQRRERRFGAVAPVISLS